MKFYPIRFLRYLFVVLIVVLFAYTQLKDGNKSELTSTVTSLILEKEIPFDDFTETKLILEPYRMFLPNFGNNESRQWFLSCTFYRMYSSLCQNNSCETNGFLFDNFDEHRLIRLSQTKNGLFLGDDCGYRCSDEAVRRQFKSKDETSIIYDEAMILTVPDGWSFQHFLDGIGPKLSQTYQYLTKYPRMKIIIERGIRFDKSVQQIWELLGLFLT